MLSRLSFNSLTRAFSHHNHAPYHKPPVKVAVTGGSGQIAYSLLFRIASGGFLGPDQPIDLAIYDLPQMQQSLRGVVMELHDAAFPTLNSLIATDVYGSVFDNVDYVFLVGAKPRGPGMERSDLLKQNGEIFVEVGKALDKHAKKTAKIITVGNPANTNCLIAMANAPSLPKENFTAMTRLDHNRALWQLAAKTDSRVTDVKNLAIWGNHSSTMYPDITSTKIKGKAAKDLVDHKWVVEEFIPVVQQRGAAIIAARKLSSAASAGSAALDHMRDWVQGTHGEWVSMAVPSDLYKGEYGVPEGLIFSYPVTCAHGVYDLVRGLKFDKFGEEKVKVTADELLSEKKAVEHLLKP